MEEAVLFLIAIVTASPERKRWPEATFAQPRLSLCIAIFSKSTAHGHFLENLASDLFNMVNKAFNLAECQYFMDVRMFLCIFIPWKV
jgi:hypothetical protein